MRPNGDGITGIELTEIPIQWVGYFPLIQTSDPKFIKHCMIFGNQLPAWQVQIHGGLMENPPGEKAPCWNRVVFPSVLHEFSMVLELHKKNLHLVILKVFPISKTLKKVTSPGDPIITSFLKPSRFFPTKGIPYWWKKSCTTWDDDYPIIYRVLCRISAINSIILQRPGDCWQDCGNSLPESPIASYEVVFETKPMKLTFHDWFIGILILA